jgi:Leucine-rich repeat (LRR) protein
MEHTGCQLQPSGTHDTTHDQTNLTRWNPNIFSDLTNLETLSLSKNYFREVDKDLFKNLPALKELSLSNNNIAK